MDGQVLSAMDGQMIVAGMGSALARSRPLLTARLPAESTPGIQTNTGIQSTESTQGTGPNQDRLITEAIENVGPRLRNFIRKNVPGREDAEDILQDVFYELIAAYRMMKPIEQVSGWLYRVARNRITDLFRRKSPSSLHDPVENGPDGAPLLLEEILPSAAQGPEAAYARTVLLEALDEALDELPPEQSEAFIAHEIMGIPFNELAEQTGERVNTLVSRKHYAVLHLRRRLKTIYDDLPH